MVDKYAITKNNCNMLLGMVSILTKSVIRSKQEEIREDLLLKGIYMLEGMNDIELGTQENRYVYISLKNAKISALRKRRKIPVWVMLDEGEIDVMVDADKGEQEIEDREFVLRYTSIWSAYLTLSIPERQVVSTLFEVFMPSIFNPEKPLPKHPVKEVINRIGKNIRNTERYWNKIKKKINTCRECGRSVECGNLVLQGAIDTYKNIKNNKRYLCSKKKCWHSVKEDRTIG